MTETDKLARILRNRADTGCAVHGQQWAEGMRCAANIIEHESASAQPASVAEPVAWQWRKRENAGDYQGEPYFVWSTWEPLVPPYMDARDLAKTDPDNYEVRPLYTRLQPPSAMAQESGDDH